MKQLRRVVLALILMLLLLVGLALASTTTDRYYNTHNAIAESAQILSACAAFRENPGSGGRYPVNLAELVKPPFGGGPYLKYGEPNLYDPWGKSYKYAVVMNAEGDAELYVWTERVVDGKLKLLGAKINANAEITKFGLPE